MLLAVCERIIRYEGKILAKDVFSTDIEPPAKAQCWSEERRQDLQSLNKQVAALKKSYNQSIAGPNNTLPPVENGIDLCIRFSSWFGVSYRPGFNQDPNQIINLAQANEPNQYKTPKALRELYFVVTQFGAMQRMSGGSQLDEFREVWNRRHAAHQGKGAANGANGSSGSNAGSSYAGSHGRGGGADSMPRGTAAANTTKPGISAAAAVLAGRGDRQGPTMGQIERGEGSFAEYKNEDMTAGNNSGGYGNNTNRGSNNNYNNNYNNAYNQQPIRDQDLQDRVHARMDRVNAQSAKRDANSGGYGNGVNSYGNGASAHSQNNPEHQNKRQRMDDSYYQNNSYGNNNSNAYNSFSNSAGNTGSGNYAQGQGFQQQDTVMTNATPSTAEPEKSRAIPEHDKEELQNLHLALAEVIGSAIDAHKGLCPLGFLNVVNNPEIFDCINQTLRNHVRYSFLNCHPSNKANVILLSVLKELTDYFMLIEDENQNIDDVNNIGRKMIWVATADAYEHELIQDVAVEKDPYLPDDSDGGEKGEPQTVTKLCQAVHSTHSFAEYKVLPDENYQEMKTRNFGGRGANTPNNVGAANGGSGGKGQQQHQQQQQQQQSANNSTGGILNSNSQMGNKGGKGSKGNKMNNGPKINNNFPSLKSNVSTGSVGSGGPGVGGGVSTSVTSAQQFGNGSSYNGNSQVGTRIGAPPAGAAGFGNGNAMSTQNNMGNNVGNGGMNNFTNQNQQGYQNFNNNQGNSSAISNSSKGAGTGGFNNQNWQQGQGTPAAQQQQQPQTSMVLQHDIGNKNRPPPQPTTFRQQINPVTGGKRKEKLYACMNQPCNTLFDKWTCMLDHMLQDCLYKPIEKVEKPMTQDSIDKAKDIIAKAQMQHHNGNPEGYVGDVVDIVRIDDGKLDLPTEVDLVIAMKEKLAQENYSWAVRKVVSWIRTSYQTMATKNFADLGFGNFDEFTSRNNFEVKNYKLVAYNGPL